MTPLFPLDYFYYTYYLYKANKEHLLSGSRISYIQNDKIKKLIRYAYDNVTYYRRLFVQTGIVPDDIQSVEDIQKIPIMTRQDIQRNKISLITAKPQNNINKYLKYMTSGSTDDPLEVFLNKNEEILQGMLYFRMLFANGYKINDKLLILTHPQFIKEEKRKYIFKHLGIFDIDYLSVFDNPKEQLKRIIQIKPDIIRGYTQSIKNIALEIKARNIKEIHPRLIFCTAEFLSKDDRGFIEDAFRTEVIDYYSTTECGLIAWECRQHTGYHINSDALIVELINNGKKALPGEKAEVIITNLNSYTMPFIRYKLGDFAISSDNLCLCGSKLPLIKTIIGRPQAKKLITA